MSCCWVIMFFTKNSKSKVIRIRNIDQSIVKEKSSCRLRPWVNGIVEVTLGEFVGGERRNDRLSKILRIDDRSSKADGVLEVFRVGDVCRTSRGHELTFTKDGFEVVRVSECVHAFPLFWVDVGPSS